MEREMIEAAFIPMAKAQGLSACFFCNKYKNCICWKNVAGYGDGCFDGYCSYDQRMACSRQQDVNRKENFL